MQPHTAATPAGEPQPLTDGAAERRLGPAEGALLLLHSMLWGSSFFFIDIAKASLPVLSINALRLVPAATILVAITLVMRLSLRPLLTRLRTFVLIAIFNNAVPLVLIIFAQRSVTGGLAAVFIATTPMFSLLVAHFLSGEERIKVNKVAGIALGITGVAVLTGGNIADGDLLAKLALITAAGCYALAGLLTRTMSGVPPLVLATGQMVMSFVISAPVALAVDRPWTMPLPDPTALVAVLCSGVFGSALAAICYFVIIGRAGATNALLVTLLIPLTPITLGAIVLGQSLRTNEIAGALVIATALLLIDGRVLGLAERLRPRRWTLAP